MHKARSPLEEHATPRGQSAGRQVRGEKVCVLGCHEDRPTRLTLHAHAALLVPLVVRASGHATSTHVPSVKACAAGTHDDAPA